MIHIPFKSCVYPKLGREVISQGLASKTLSHDSGSVHSYVPGVAGQVAFLSSYQTVEKSPLSGKALRYCEKTIPLLSRGHLVDLVEGEPSKRMDSSPKGRGHAQRRPPLLSGFDQPCSEIPSSEFSVFAQVCKDGG